MKWLSIHRETKITSTARNECEKQFLIPFAGVVGALKSELAVETWDWTVETFEEGPLGTACVTFWGGAMAGLKFSLVLETGALYIPTANPNRRKKTAMHQKLVAKIRNKNHFNQRHSKKI